MTAQFYIILQRVIQRLSQHNLKISQSPYLKASSNKIMIQTQFVGMSKNTNFKFQPTSTFAFFIFHKNGLVKRCSSFKDVISIQNVMVTRWLIQVLHPPQKFERPPLWNGWSYDIKVWGRGHHKWYGLLAQFHENVPTGSDVISGEIQTYRQTDGLTDGQTAWWSHKPRFPFLREVG
jgi:hypothetical protein